MFIAFEVSLSLVESLRSVVPAIQRNDRDLADQVRRAASSVSLNLAEGQRSHKGNQAKHYALAHGRSKIIVIDKLTPKGRVEQSGDMTGMLASLKSQFLALA